MSKKSVSRKQSRKQSRKHYKIRGKGIGLDNDEKDNNEINIIPQFTDFKIISKDNKVINCHKILLISSDYFKTILIDSDGGDKLNELNVDANYEVIVHILYTFYDNVYDFRKSSIHLPHEQYISYIKLCFKWMSTDFSLYDKSTDHLYHMMITLEPKKIENELKKSNHNHLISNLKTTKEIVAFKKSLRELLTFLDKPIYTKPNQSKFSGSQQVSFLIKSIKKLLEKYE